MRNFFDNAIAGVGTVLLHAAIIALLLVGFRWERTPPPPLRTTLKASVVSDEAFRLAEDEIEQSAVPELPAPTPEPEAPPLPDPAEVERERERVAEQERQQLEAAQAEQQRQDEARLKRQLDAEREAAAEVERQRQADEAREREAEAARQKQAAEAAERERREAAEAERKRKEAEAERQRQAEAERRRREEEQRKQALEAQLRDALEAEEARAGAIDAGLQAQYVELIRQSVTRNWSRPPGVPDGITCEIVVRQLRNGVVATVRVDRCEGGDAVLIRSIETAVNRASPLPPPPDPSLFEPNLRFPFKTGE